uniref:Tick serine protease n=1 Tax=Rhipicephalus zambeziensis TaxID=60191 RepID=A0A224YF35_9ACAR
MKFHKAAVVLLLSALAWTRCRSSGQTKGHWPLHPSTSSEDLLLPVTNDFVNLDKIEHLRNASRVTLPAPCSDLEAFSGFIPVDGDRSTFLFFLHIKSQNDSRQKPLLLWLQGGVGESSLYGQFLENGPLGIDASGKLYRRKHSLLNNFNIIYLDQPAGAGYSFDKNGNYPTTLQQATTHGVRFLRRFLRMFEEYRDRDFFIAGESYGARSAIGLAQRMLTRKPQDQFPLRLKGVMLGVGFVFPLLDMINSAKYLYCSSLLDEQGRDSFDMQFRKIKYMATVRNFTAAAEQLRQTVFDMHPAGQKSLFELLTGFENHGSIVKPVTPMEVRKYQEYANSEEFKKLIHVATSRTLDATRTELAMKLAAGEFFAKRTSTLVHVLNNVRVLFYTAQLDSVFPASKMERLFKKLQWRGSVMFWEAARKPWYQTTPHNAHKVLLGYEKVAGAVMYNTVLFGGHQISFDQSAAVSDLYARFLKFTSMPAPRRCEESKSPC